MGNNMQAVKSWELKLWTTPGESRTTHLRGLLPSCWGMRCGTNLTDCPNDARYVPSRDAFMALGTSPVHTLGQGFPVMRILSLNLSYCSRNILVDTGLVGLRSEVAQSRRTLK
jgi:hypothetical protein